MSTPNFWDLEEEAESKEAEIAISSGEGTSKTLEN